MLPQLNAPIMTSNSAILSSIIYTSLPIFYFVGKLINVIDLSNALLWKIQSAYKWSTALFYTLFSIKYIFSCKNKRYMIE
jgi:hypothetical protein